MPAESCLTCRYSFAPIGAAALLCRRFPPQIIALSQTQQNKSGELVQVNGPTYWFPLVDVNVWCGEFRSR
jgi:hypothetical protein